MVNRQGIIHIHSVGLTFFSLKNACCFQKKYSLMKKNVGGEVYRDGFGFLQLFLYFRSVHGGILASEHQIVVQIK